VKRFEVAKRALRDLEEILDFIAERSPDAADRVRDDSISLFVSLRKIQA
jgi:plasmid stabilization system protein ParE